MRSQKRCTIESQGLLSHGTPHKQISSEICTEGHLQRIVHEDLHTIIPHHE